MLQIITTECTHTSNEQGFEKARVHTKNSKGECLTRTYSESILLWLNKGFIFFSTYQQHSTPINGSLSSVTLLFIDTFQDMQ